jgi:hypothetical protein
MNWPVKPTVIDCRGSFKPSTPDAESGQLDLRGSHKMHNNTQAWVPPVPNVPGLFNGHGLFSCVARGSDQFQSRFGADK